MSHSHKSTHKPEPDVEPQETSTPPMRSREQVENALDYFRIILKGSQLTNDADTGQTAQKVSEVLEWCLGDETNGFARIIKLANTLTRLYKK